MTSKNILLTGASGFLGYRVLEQLQYLPEIEKIIANGRTPRPGMTIDNPKVEYRLGDLSDSDFVNEMVHDVDAIIHCAAISSPWGSLKAFKLANVQTQKNLIEAAVANKLKRFVFISTPSIYFNYHDRFNIREDEPLPLKFVNHYAATKRQAELLLESSPLEYIILRPRALIGRGDQTIMPRMIRAYNEKRLKIVGSGKNLVDLTAVSNVVDSIILSLQADSKACNQVYNISNGNPVRLWEYIEYTLKKLDLEMPRKRVPFRLAFLVAAFMERFAKMTRLKREPSLTKYSVANLAVSMTMDITKAKKLLGYTPKKSIKEAIDEFVSWYKQYERS